MTVRFVRTTAAMGTVVTLDVVMEGTSRDERAECERRVADAMGWFVYVESVCTRFDPASEVMRLIEHVGDPTPASDVLYEATRYALAVAEASEGAFDPTVGARMERLGFNREYRTGQVFESGLPADDRVSYRDVLLDEEERTITLVRPLVLDLGAVAKGLAVDLAARALRPFPNYAIDAGGDLFLAGENAERHSWGVGIRHPRRPQDIIETLHVSDLAVCTSGDYEQRTPDDTAPHIVDARTGSPALELASVTVVAPTAMAADALATAAFALGPSAGFDFLQRQGVDGFLLTPALERLATDGMARYAASDAVREGRGR